MGFYGTLKLIFFKVSIDDWIDQLIGAAAGRLVRDDEAFLPRNTSLARARPQSTADVLRSDD